MGKNAVRNSRKVGRVIMGALCIIASVVLAILRVCGVIDMGWLTIATPAIAGMAVEFILNLLVRD